MSNWKLINKTYLYDGTFDGFLTIVFNSYASKTLPQKIFSKADYSPNFLDKTLKEVGKNLYYASIHPDNNIIEPLGHHFIRRLPTQNFIIHDKTRNTCLLYDGKEYQIIDGTNIKIPNISAKEQKYQELWKLFFKTISIPERKNPRCQMQYMPKKYWKDLIEEP